MELTGQPHPQPIDLSVLHEDDHLLVVDKPAGMVVHPGAGNADGTLQNGLLHRFSELAALPRAGLLHRLDKGTSGAILVAKTLTAHTHVGSQIHNICLSKINGACPFGLNKSM